MSAGAGARARAGVAGSSDLSRKMARTDPPLPPGRSWGARWVRLQRGPLGPRLCPATSSHSAFLHPLRTRPEWAPKESKETAALQGPTCGEGHRHTNLGHLGQVGRNPLNVGPSGLRLSLYPDAKAWRGPGLPGSWGREEAGPGEGLAGAKALWPGLMQPGRNSQDSLGSLGTFSSACEVVAWGLALGVEWHLCSEVA